MKVELKNVKVHNDMSEETACFSATIYIDGKKAGEARNQGHGGPTNYHILDPKLRLAFEAFANSQPPVKSDYSPDGLKMTPDFYLDLLLERYEEDKMLKRHAKTKTIFRTTKQKAGEWLILNRLFSPAIKAELQRQHGDSLLEIGNERFCVVL